MKDASTNRRFKFDAPSDKVFELLKSNCKILVEKRRMDFIEDADTVRHLKMIAKWLTEDNMKQSLLMFGGLGNGKTTMSHAIAESFSAFKASLVSYGEYHRRKYIESIEHLKLEEYWQYVGLCNQKCEGLKDAENAISRLPSYVLQTSAQQLADLAGNRDELDKIKKAPFLIIDDLGCEPTEVKVFGTAITPVVDTIYFRYDNLLSTVITTNLDKTKIKEIYGLRVADRIEEMCESIAFTNKSYRNGYWDQSVRK